MSNAKFYTAVGMPEILDMKDQGAPTVNERDRFYFNNALSLMEKHFKNSQRPLFTFIETMSAHSPYTYKWSPEVDVPGGGGPGTPPEMHEYLRRLSMTKIDYDWFRAGWRSGSRVSASSSCTTVIITRWPPARCSAHRTTPMLRTSC